MKNLSNVQKKENLNKEATKANEVTLIGNNVELLFTNKRYSALKNLFEEMENNLKTPLNFDVNISCVMLEAFAKGIIEDDGLVELFQTNMAPKSFFCFVNDLSLARKHTSSREIINILSSAEFLPNIMVLQPQNNWINVKNFILFANFKIVYDKIIFDEDDVEYLE